MQFIKAAVIGMGVLILIGLGLLVYGFATQLGKQADGVPARYDRSHDLPADASVLTTHIDGGRLIIETRSEGAGRVYYLYDLETGAALGRLDIAPSDVR
ncbi:MAG: hypothetical protein QNJ84_08505 [Alphaproteobacteria bacterium]|nr:hypothetical protein [Alphaproteobacteria bacterium]